MSFKSAPQRRTVIFPPEVEAEMQKLIAQLTQPDEAARRQVLPPLRPLTTPELLQHIAGRLADILQNGDEVLWRPAMASLVDIGEHALPGLIAALSHHHAGAVRVRMLEALGAVGQRLGQPARTDVHLVLLGELWTGADAEALLACGRAEGALRRLDQGKGFFAEFDRDDSMPTPSPVVDIPDLDNVFAEETSLAEMTAELQAQLLQLEQGLTNPDEACRLAALAQLRQLGNPDAIPHMTIRLAIRVGHGEEPSWRLAMAALAELGNPARESLNLALMADLSDAAKARLLEALGAVGLKLEPAERETLQWYFGLELSADQAEEVRQASARALAALRQQGLKEAQAHIRANRRRGKPKACKGEQTVSQT
jgi:HEAT repeat protein